MASNSNIFSRAECKFTAGAASVEQIPHNLFLPEVAFAGRSNSGKSSLINALVGQKDLARTSKFPGRTQQINFFTISGKLSICDLPGYGYAAVSKKMRNLWDQLILDYLSGRQNLRRVFLLIDARRGIQKNDLAIMDLLDAAAVVYQIVLTKVDQIDGSSDVIQQTEDETSRRAAAYPQILITSAQNGTGIAALGNEIVALM
ncbi:MAG: ribosome biogenesis GTP-binding protein YihA/YsxC [Holosporaceae bacterium]|jgi:GTP-binding protein|nr:ribosome biogenesis GTP-binding protein YihA/YsxC [Holosporaceae bacterium]